VAAAKSNPPFPCFHPGFHPCRRRRTVQAWEVLIDLTGDWCYICKHGEMNPALHLQTRLLELADPDVNYNKQVTCRLRNRRLHHDLQWPNQEAHVNTSERLPASECVAQATANTRLHMALRSRGIFHGRLRWSRRKNKDKVCQSFE
jgi:hypothetical protein